MTIAELFVQIGVKGDGSVKKSLGGVNEGLGQIQSSALLAKAGLLAVVYGIERLTSGAAQRGMELQQFAAATGLSAQELQKWQYAARQFGVQGEEVAGSLKSIQAAMTSMILGKGAPEGIGIIARMVGGFDPARARDTFYVLDKLKEFAKVAPPDIGSSILKNFGVSDSMFQFLRQSNLDLNKIKPSLIYSDREIAQLAKVDAAWNNLFNTVKMFSGHIAAGFGLEAVGRLSNAFRFVSSLTKDIANLSAEFPKLTSVIKVAAAAIALYFAPITTLVTGIIYAFSELQKYKEGKDSIFATIGSWYDDISKKLNLGSAKDLLSPKQGAPNMIAPPISGDKNVNNQNSVTVNQTMNFQHSGENAQEVANSTRRAITGIDLNNAVRQMPATAQVN